MLELKPNEKREISLRTILAFTFVMDLVLYQLIYPREQNKENNGDIQQRKDEMKFSLHFFLFQSLSKSSHNHIPHFRYLFLGQQNLFSLSFTASKQRHCEINRDTQQKEKQKKTQVERIFVQIFFCYSNVFSASKQRERTWLHADQNLKSHRFFNFLGNQTGSNSKVQSIRVGTYSRAPESTRFNSVA